ncbi:MAG: hypothetical protein ACHQZQ_04310 [SAR324 cluster bacterium]
MWIQATLDSLAAVANAATILAAGWAFYVYWRNRDKLTAALNALRQYGTRTTLAELLAELDRLSRMTPEELADREMAVHLLGDIQGQIEGHPELRQRCRAELRSIEALLRSEQTMFGYEFQRIVSRLKETLKHRDIEIGQETAP